MKWIVIALLLAGLISCGDDEPIAPTYIDNGEVSVTLNGEDFFSQYQVGVRALSGSPCYPDRLSLNVTYYNQADVERVGFDIQNIPFKLGTYEIKEIKSNNSCLSDTVNGSFGTSVADGDVNGDMYYPLESEDNTVTLTSYDPSAREVEGTFEITFVISEKHRANKTVIDAPDTIRLTNGKFKAYDIR